MSRDCLVHVCVSSSQPGAWHVEGVQQKLTERINEAGYSYMSFKIHVARGLGLLQKPAVSFRFVCLAIISSQSHDLGMSCWWQTDFSLGIPLPWLMNWTPSKGRAVSNTGIHTSGHLWNKNISMAYTGLEHKMKWFRKLPLLFIITGRFWLHFQISIAFLPLLRERAAVWASLDWCFLKFDMCFLLAFLMPGTNITFQAVDILRIMKGLWDSCKDRANRACQQHLGQTTIFIL